VKQPLKKQNHDSSNGGASKNDDAAAGTSKGSASEGSASDGSASDGSASDGSASEGSASGAFVDDEEDSHSIGCDGVAHVDDELTENLNSEMQSQHTYNDLSDDLSVFESACGDIVFIRDLARTALTDLNAAQLSVGGSVTVENAEKVRAFLNQIKSGFNSLAALASQYRVTYGMPANAYLPLEGSDVGASDVLSNACSEANAFDQTLSYLYDQFDVLKSQVTVVVSSSKEANAPQHMCALPAERCSSFPSKTSSASSSMDKPEKQKRRQKRLNPFEFSSVAGLHAEPGRSVAWLSSALTASPSAESPLFHELQSSVSRLPLSGATATRLAQASTIIMDRSLLTPSAVLSSGNSAGTIIASGEQAQSASPSSLSATIGLLSAQDDTNLSFSLERNSNGNRKDSELYNLEASGEEANESHDAPQHTASSVSTDFQSQSKFFTVSKCTDIVLELMDRYKCNFVEHSNMRGMLIQIESQRDTKKPWTSARHFVSDSYVAKVYRISSDAGSSQFSSRELSQALHESAATAYICKKLSWFHDVFGVLISDSDAVHVHICMIRARLDSKNLTPSNVSDACISLLKSCGVMHGDGHLGNAKYRIGSDVIELLDFERAFMIHSSDDLISMIQSYATADDQGRQSLLKRMKKLGMDATRLRFKEFVQGCCVSNINDWTLDDILSVFKGAQFSSDTSSVKRFLRFVVLFRHITTGTLVVNMPPFGDSRLWCVNEFT
jgi:hypothetical protein